MLLLIAIDIDHRNTEFNPKDKRQAWGFEGRTWKKEGKFIEVFDALKKKKDRLFLIRVLTKYLQFKWTPFQILIKECKISVRINLIIHAWVRC